ncbi:MAG: TetR/AcrR family transcriptional regulator [Hyphomonadaceae bacterium]|nr:TetR/AcrR family transcriptional regulator [Hyphomonadaceae bacterium]
MTKQTRKQGPKRSEESRAAILEGTREELAENGWRKFSVDSVAKRAHASKQTIYRWWPSVGTMCVDSGLELLPPQGRQGRDPIERLTDIFLPLEIACRAGHGHAVLRASLIAAADDQAAGEYWRKWMNDTLRMPLRNLLAELTAKRIVRRDWDIDTAMQIMLGGFWHRLVFTRAPITEGYIETQAKLLLTLFAPE